MSQETTIETFWEKLRSLYEKKTAQNKAFIARKLVNLKLKEEIGRASCRERV